MFSEHREEQGKGKRQRDDESKEIKSIRDWIQTMWDVEGHSSL